MRDNGLVMDEIGEWSLVKHDILREYAVAYSKIFNAKRQQGFYHVYVDAFAGSGVSMIRGTDEIEPGSPLLVLDVDPPFREYHFVDLDDEKADQLEDFTKQRGDVRVHRGDCNRILVDEVFPKISYADYRRGLCLLDPYGL